MRFPEIGNSSCYYVFHLPEKPLHRDSAFSRLREDVGREYLKSNQAPSFSKPPLFTPNPPSPLKLTLLAQASAAFALLLAPTSALAVDAPAAPSPIGTWEIALAGADQGIAYVTFEADHDFTAYGISAKSRGVFTLSGTWTIDPQGQVTGSYAELIDGQNVTGNISGKLAGKGRSLSGKIAATNGDFTFKGTPETDTQSLGGTWQGIVSFGKTQTKTRITEVYQLSPSKEFPHIFVLAGEGVTVGNDSFTIEGVAIAGAKGRVRIYAESAYPWKLDPSPTQLLGVVNAAKRKGALKGYEMDGQLLKVALKR